MGLAAIHRKMTERDEPSRLLSPLAYNPDDNTFFCEEGALGFAVRLNPRAGIDSSAIEQFRVLLHQPDLPPNTLMQVSQWVSPDIERVKSHMKDLHRESARNIRSEGQRIAGAMFENRIEFLSEHTERPISEHSPVQVHDISVIVTVKIPCRGNMPSERDVEVVRRIARSVTTVFTAMSMAPEILDAEKYLRVLGSMVNWGPDASWRKQARIYDDRQLIRDQVFDTQAPVFVHEDGGGLRLGRKHVKVLSVKRPPDHVHASQAAQFIGDAVSGKRGIPGCVLITTNIIIPDAEAERTKFGAKQKGATWQSINRLARYVPQIKKQADSFDAMMQALENGDRTVYAYTTFVLFEDTIEAADEAVSNATTYLQEHGYRLQPDAYVALPLFLNALPLCSEVSARTNLARYRPMATCHLAHMVPLYGEWKGTGTPALTLLGRRGQLAGIDLFDSETNNSAVIAAESGAGKSFFVNFLVANYMALGADIYLIEVGRSFKNLCNRLDGQHMEFDTDSRLSLNPFTTIVDFTNQTNLLIAVLLAMISPKGEVTELQEAQLREIVRDVWNEHGSDASIDDVARKLKDYRDQEGNVDQRISDMGIQLGAFTSEGQYGHWFKGRATINFNKSLTVLELQELKEHDHLMKVVMVQLMAVIQRAMVLGDTGRRKLLIIDEGWDLITSGAEGKFIEGGFRQLRKANGGVILILQGVNDLYRTPVGEGIAENSAFTILMHQKPEAIRRLIASEKLAMGPGAAEVLTSVHSVKHVYSEMFLATGGRGAGIVRLYVDRASELMYSTDPMEKAAIEERRARGMTLEEAITDIVVQEREDSTTRARAA